MRQPDNRSRRFGRRDTVLLSGWLFADLLLALTVIFLSANTVGVTPRPIPTPTVGVPVTPTSLPRLELDPQSIQLQINAAGLLIDSSDAQNMLAQEIRNQKILQGRVVGLVIVYGNAPDPSLLPTGLNISRKVMGVMQTLGQQGFAFARTSYYQPLAKLYFTDVNVTEIDLYLFAQ